jgi:hypothetical protein
MRALIAIDPGLSGGIAWRGSDHDGSMVVCFNMPKTIKDMYDCLDGLKKSLINPMVMMEKVGKHRMGNSAQSSATFAKHVGHLEMALVTTGLPTYEVTASSWMKEIVPGRPKGVESQQVRARKNYIKDLMQRHHPHLKVTLATADALGILEYAIRNQDRY